MRMGLVIFSMFIILASCTEEVKVTVNPVYNSRLLKGGNLAIIPFDIKNELMKEILYGSMHFDTTAAGRERARKSYSVSGFWQTAYFEEKLPVLMKENTLIDTAFYFPRPEDTTLFFPKKDYHFSAEGLRADYVLLLNCRIKETEISSGGTFVGPFGGPLGSNNIYVAESGNYMSVDFVIWDNDKNSWLAFGDFKILIDLEGSVDKSFEKQMSKISNEIGSKTPFKKSTLKSRK